MRRSLLGLSLLILLLLPAVIHAGVESWSATVTTTTNVFQGGLPYRVELAGNSTDLTIQWLSNTIPMGLMARLCLLASNPANCTPDQYYLPPGDTTINPGTGSVTVVPGFVPMGQGPANITFALFNGSAPNASVDEESSRWVVVSTRLGAQDGIRVQIVSSEAAAAAAPSLSSASFDVEVITRNYTCEWDAAGADMSLTAPLVLSDQPDYLPACVVPDTFDSAVPAGTNFTMSLLRDSDGWKLPPTPGTGPVVQATGAVLVPSENQKLPTKMCTEQKMTLHGYFFANRTYGCTLEPLTIGVQSWDPPFDNERAIYCTMLQPGGTVQIRRLNVYEASSHGVFFIGSIQHTFTLAVSCESGDGGGGDQAWPYWAWIVVGLGAVGGLLLGTGLLLVAYVKLFRSDYARVGNSPLLSTNHNGDSLIYLGTDHRDAIDRKTFSGV